MKWSHEGSTRESKGRSGEIKLRWQMCSVNHQIFINTVAIIKLSVVYESHVEIMGLFDKIVTKQKYSCIPLEFSKQNSIAIPKHVCSRLSAEETSASKI